MISTGNASTKCPFGMVHSMARLESSVASAKYSARAASLTAAATKVTGLASQTEKCGIRAWSRSFELLTVGQGNHGKVFILRYARRRKQQSWFASGGEYSTVAAILNAPH